jgi:hypothetical protein
MAAYAIFTSMASVSLKLYGRATKLDTAECRWLTFPRGPPLSSTLGIRQRGRQCLSIITADGHELRRIGPDVVAAKYPDFSKYHPTNAAVTPDGDFFISDGYGSSFIRHFDP